MSILSAQPVRFPTCEWGCTYCGQDNEREDNFCDNCHEYNDVVPLCLSWGEKVARRGPNIPPNIQQRKGWSFTRNNMNATTRFDYKRGWPWR